mmetsp:Transcript_4965/g.13500  ORF Transcript_4965/g.13500 Transcript_4965/m.13500 type:complete len:215 (-) Transcript_4965:702-1346(-)
MCLRRLAVRRWYRGVMAMMRSAVGCWWTGRGRGRGRGRGSVGAAVLTCLRRWRMTSVCMPCSSRFDRFAMQSFPLSAYLSLRLCVGFVGVPVAPTRLDAWTCVCVCSILRVANAAEASVHLLIHTHRGGTMHEVACGRFLSPTRPVGRPCASHRWPPSQPDYMAGSCLPTMSLPLHTRRRTFAIVSRLSSSEPGESKRNHTHLPVNLLLVRVFL